MFLAGQAVSVLGDGLAVLVIPLMVFFESVLVVVVKYLFAVSGLMGANSALELVSQISLIAGPPSRIRAVPPCRISGPAVAGIRGQYP